MIVPSPATTVTLGDLHKPTTLLALFGIALIAILQALRVRSAILIGVLGTLFVGILLHQVPWQPAALNPLAIRATAFHLDVRSALHLNALEIIFVFLFVDLFDNLGTLVAVTERAGLISPDGTVPRLGRIFLADAVSTVVGSLAGTSTVTSYVESASGVAAGAAPGSRRSSPASCSFCRFLLRRSWAPSQLCYRACADPGGRADGRQCRTD